MEPAAVRKYTLPVLFFLLLLQASYLSAYVSAHAIVVSEWGFDPQGKPVKYVLLGLTDKGKLSDFGGFKDQGETNPKDTAAREIEEETLGVLGNRSQMRVLLRGKQAVNPGKPDHPHYVLYPKYYGNVVKKFRQKRFGKHTVLNHSQKEMVDLVPVRIDELKKGFAGRGPAFAFDNKGQKRYFRGGTEGAIRLAIRQGEL